MSETKKISVHGDLNWPMVLLHIHVQILGVYGLILCFTSAKLLTVLFTLALIFVSTIGVTAGAHRLYAHGSFNGTKFLRLFIILAQTMAGVGSVYDWVLDHRMHHKFYGTDKDIFNPNKGFLHSHFFSHVFKKSEDYEKLKKDIDMRDMDMDGFVWLQKQFYWLFYIIFCLLLPINAPAEYWGESLNNSIYIAGFFRLAIMMNITSLMQSGILIWGIKPGGRFPVDDNSIFFITKSFWLNYHYKFPWDWRSGEFGGYDTGLITLVIKIWKELGLIDTMKTISSEDVRESLYRVTLKNKKGCIDDVIYDLQKVSKQKALEGNLRYYH